MLEFIALGLTVAINFLIGLFVFIKNPKSYTNRMFFVLTTTFVLWSVVNFISVHPVVFSQLFWVRFVLFWGSILNFSVFMTFLTFPKHELEKKYRKRAKRAFLATVLVAPLTLTPLVFKELSVASGSSQPVPNPGIVLFLLHTVTLLGYGIFTIITKFKAARGKEKNQLRVVLFGIAGTFGLIVVANFLLVVLLNVTALVPFGPTFTVIFSSSMAYAIIRHRLFDIRAAVARSVAYVLLTGSIALVYSLGLFGVINVIFAGSEQELLRQVLSVILVLPLVLSFQSIKRFFDRLTNRIFYRDSYDTQEVLDSLGNLLVAEIDLQKVINGTRRVLEDSLKSSFIEFILFRGDKMTFESDKRQTVQAEINELAVHIKSQHKDLLVTDELSENSPFRHAFTKDNVALSLRLKTQRQIVGYILFGEKRSGDIYSTQDRKLLTIVANELAIAVQNALRFEEIENFNLTLQQKVVEATRQLRRSNEKLKALDETKDEFISMASHQLRTPLTSVKGYISMVIEGDAGKITAPQRKLLDQAFISSQRMVYLIADLLNVSRLKTGKFIIETAPSNLADVVEGEISQLVETAAGRHLELTYKKPHDFPTLMLDETKIRQVIMNFVDNAIYYTPAGGHIDVTLTETPAAVEFRVTDDGIGIPKHEQHHLFGKFYRAGNAKKARPDGTGLGLFMAKKVIIAQGGSLIFTSQEGKGSTFGFTFPKAKLTNNLPPKTLETSQTP